MDMEVCEQSVFESSLVLQIAIAVSEIVWIAVTWTWKDSMVSKPQ